VNSLVVVSTLVSLVLINVDIVLCLVVSSGSLVDLGASSIVTT